jgi:hypothetical protein
MTPLSATTLKIMTFIKILTPGKMNIIVTLSFMLAIVIVLSVVMLNVVAPLAKTQKGKMVSLLPKNIFTS